MRVGGGNQSAFKIPARTMISHASSSNMGKPIASARS